MSSFVARSTIHRWGEWPSPDFIQRKYNIQANWKEDGPGSQWNTKEAPKLDFNENLYEIIEAAEDASPEELKKAYYKVVFKYHPDNKESDAEKELCNRQMMVINHAYKILKDPVSREEYDKKIGISRPKRRSESSSQTKQRKVNYDDISTSPSESSHEEFQSLTGSKFKKMMEEMWSKSPELREQIMKKDGSSRYGQQPLGNDYTSRKDTDYTSTMDIEDEVGDLLYQFGDGSLESMRVSYNFDYTKLFLKLTLAKMIARKIRMKKEEIDKILADDTRDWGEVILPLIVCIFIIMIIV